MGYLFIIIFPMLIAFVYEYMKLLRKLRRNNEKYY